MTAIKSLLFLILVPGTVAGWVPLWLNRWHSGLPELELGVWRHLGWLLVVPGVAVLLWTVFDFARVGKGTPAPIDPPTAFVASGLYRIVRNPMYVGVLAAVLGQFLLYQSTNVLAYGVVLWGCFHAFVVLYEEPALRRRFGDDYVTFCRQVPRWIPRLRAAKTR
jgi:protein-S-isoprenylcysteine O-methyltransferase Ste14